MPSAFTRLLVLCLLAYGWVVHGYLGWNPESHLTLTYAIVDGHTLSIDAYAAQLGDRAMVGEHYYTDKLPFQSFMAVPMYAALRTLIQPVAGITPDTATLFVRYLLTWVVVGVPGALGVALLWNETRRLGATPATATLVGLAYGLGSL